MNGVMKEVDLRAFPMEIAKHLLALGKPLSMATGVVAFLEAEMRLSIYLEILGDYSLMFFDKPLLKQNEFVRRFVQMHSNNPNLLESQARQLLDSMNYLPESVRELPYEEHHYD